MNAVICPQCGRAITRAGQRCKCGWAAGNPVAETASVPAVPPVQTIVKRKISAGERVFIVICIIIGIMVLPAFIPGWGSSNSSTTNAATRQPVPVAASTPAPTPLPDKANAEAIDPRQLTADAVGLTGRNVVLVGEALAVSYNRDGSDPHTWVQLMAQVKDRPGITEPIVVEVRPLNTSILRAECYRVYGMTAGTQRVTRSLTGATNEAPLVNGYLVEPVLRDKSSRCGA